MMRSMLAVLAVYFAIAARPTPVEVLSPMPPTPVVANGKRVLCYELHITNFGTTPLVLQTIDISSTKPPLEFAGEALKAMLRPVGETSGGDVARLEPGRRVIAFLWIALPLDALVPETLVHRLTFEDSAIDDVNVPVLRKDVPVLSPFADGDWYAGSAPSNSSVHRRSVIALGGKAYIGQRFAIDFVKVGSNGDSIHESRERNENFWVFGQPLRAVADGEITEVVDMYPDNKPGTPLQPPAVESAAGNHVIMLVADGVYVAFAHLQAHSVRVRAHEKIRRGTIIGNVGNSGNSTGPHLHFEVVNGNSVLAAEGIPFLFDRFSFIGWGATFDANKHPVEPRRREMPVDDEVLRFP